MRAMRLVLAGGLAVGLAGPARPSEREGLKELAAALAKSTRAVAEKNKQSAVRVGFFTPSGLDHANAGGAFMAELAAALGAFVNPNAAFELKGEFLLVPDPLHPALKVIRVKARLTDTTTGDDVTEFKELVGDLFIRANPDIARLTGAVVAFKRDTEYRDPREGRNKDIQDGLPDGGNRPPDGRPPAPPKVQAHINGTLVSADPDCQFAVEIRARPLEHGGRPAEARTPTLMDGLPFVRIDKGELYEVRAVNNSPHEVAVSVAIDGIDQFAFSDDRVRVTDKDGKPVLDEAGKPVTRRLSHFIVAASKGGAPGEVVIPGWHKTAGMPDLPGKPGSGKPGRFLSFLVTDYGSGAASKFPTQALGKVGTITVGFARSFPPGSRGAGAETGFGPPVEVIQEVVKRDIDAPHAFVTVRYAR